MSSYSRRRNRAVRGWLAITTPVVFQTSCSIGSFDYLQKGSIASTAGASTREQSSPGGTTNIGSSGGVSAVFGGNSATGGLGGTEATSLGGAGGIGSSVSTAGTSAAGGATGSTGGTSTARSSTSCEGDPNVVGSATRPQLTTAAAANYTTLDYLAKAGPIGALIEDDWDPTAGLGNASRFNPTYVVSADGTGTHTSLQSALDAVRNALDAGTPSADRIYILLKPGTYREVVCVDLAPPVTIYGSSEDASAVQIIFDNNAGKPLDGNINPCTAGDASTYGPAASATLAVKSNDVEIKNVTIVNDFVEGSDPYANGQQAVAILTEGDRTNLENVRILGNHYTALFGTPDPGVVARVYLKDSYVAGDMQFIVGRATVVIESSEIHCVTSRLSPPLGSIMAASTAAQNAFGFLVNKTRLTVDATTNSNWVLMGRSWDQGFTSYEAGNSPNGQIIVRDSWMDSHVQQTQPWGNALETARLYDCHGNRLYEYANIGPGSAK